MQFWIIASSIIAVAFPDHAEDCACVVVFDFNIFIIFEVVFGEIVHFVFEHKFPGGSPKVSCWRVFFFSASGLFSTEESISFVSHDAACSVLCVGLVVSIDLFAGAVRDTQLVSFIESVVEKVSIVYETGCPAACAESFLLFVEGLPVES